MIDFHIMYDNGIRESIEVQGMDEQVFAGILNMIQALDDNKGMLIVPNGKEHHYINLTKVTKIEIRVNS